MYNDWVSKETYHFCRATLAKVRNIKSNHNYLETHKAIVLLMKHIWKIKGMKSQKVIFQKSQELLIENLHERPSIQNIQFQWPIM